MIEPTLRARILFRGIVQGVGFRYFVLKRAAEFSITGLARNLPGSEVEVIAEGDRQEIERFFDAIREGPVSAVVREAKIFWEPASGGYPDFRIGY
ncbi:MAG TPA: acylphosphatase [Atribacteraceae bacterium]|nr:acylphosphatase [Atribacteraceae bacterium]